METSPDFRNLEPEIQISTEFNSKKNIVRTDKEAKQSHSKIMSFWGNNSCIETQFNKKIQCN